MNTTSPWKKIFVSQTTDNVSSLAGNSFVNIFSHLFLLITDEVPHILKLDIQEEIMKITD